MFVGELRPFQVPAVERFITDGRLLLALHQGLGKTVTSIAALERLLDSGEARHGLIVVPPNLKWQWADSIKQFTDGASVLVIDGPKETRKLQYFEACNYEYIILGYTSVRGDKEEVFELNDTLLEEGGTFVVLDEATAIKTPDTLTARAVKGLDADYRLALTGTPIENRPDEGFSIMEWVDPEILGEWSMFDRTFVNRHGNGSVVSYQNLDLFHELMTSAMVRKSQTDPDVAPYLPKVEEVALPIRLTGPARDLYIEIADELIDRLMSMPKRGGVDIASLYGRGRGGKSNIKELGRIMSRLTCLRMLCDHPQLLLISAGKYAQSQQLDEGIKGGSAYAHSLANSGRLDWVKDGVVSDKQSALVDRLRGLFEEDGSKVVVFTFFKDMAKMIAATQGMKSVLYTGDMDLKAKHAAKQKFTNDPSVRLFVSTDAGGYGLDLPAANYLVSYDLPWSAGAYDQRRSRIIRLSSKWERLLISSFQIRGSIEQRQYTMLRDKQLLADAIVDGKLGSSDGTLKLSASTLLDFLLEGDV